MSTRDFRNSLLTMLPLPELERLQPFLEFVRLDLRQVIERPGRNIKHVYFPEAGLLSVVARAAPRHQIEVGLIGYEGMTGFGLLLDDEFSVNEIIVQSPGAGWCVPAEVLRQSIRASNALHRHLLRYVQSFLAQASQTALANGRAKLEQRLARWLLMSQDRFEDNHIVVTHDFLAGMLGVRRAGVTLALHMLESKGLIRSTRSLVTIRDRRGLRAEANGSYGVAEAVHERLFGRRSFAADRMDE
jgi:CRP-like cAMP-binding protein